MIYKQSISTPPADIYLSIVICSASSPRNIPVSRRRVINVATKSTGNCINARSPYVHEIKWTKSYVEISCRAHRARSSLQFAQTTTNAKTINASRRTASVAVSTQSNKLHIRSWSKTFRWTQPSFSATNFKILQFTITTASVFELMDCFKTIFTCFRIRDCFWALVDLFNSP